jgi:hypothetical protein
MKVSKDCSERLRIVAESTWKNFLFLLGRLQTKERETHIFMEAYHLVRSFSGKKQFERCQQRFILFSTNIRMGGGGELLHIFFQFINEYIQERKGTQSEQIWPL